MKRLTIEIPEKKTPEIITSLKTNDALELLQYWRENGRFQSKFHEVLNTMIVEELENSDQAEVNELLTFMPIDIKYDAIRHYICKHKNVRNGIYLLEEFIDSYANEKLPQDIIRILRH